MKTHVSYDDPEVVNWAGKSGAICHTSGSLTFAGRADATCQRCKIRAGRLDQQGRALERGVSASRTPTQAPPDQRKLELLLVTSALLIAAYALEGIVCLAAINAKRGTRSA